MTARETESHEDTRLGDRIVLVLTVWAVVMIGSAGVGWWQPMAAVSVLAVLALLSFMFSETRRRTSR